MKKVICLLAIVALVAFAVSAGGQGEAAEEEQIIIRAGHVNPPGEPAHEAWNLFEKIMEERLGDRVDVQIFPQGQLGGERDLIEQVQVGTLDMTAPSAGPLANYNKELLVLNLPYIFASEDEMWQVLDGDIGGRLIESTLEKADILILDWWSTGVRHMFTDDTPIRTPDDMAGMKIRVMENPVFIDSFQALGALPTPLPYPAVYESIQTGIVKGAENDSSGYRNMNFFEVAPYYSLTSHLIITKPLLVNPDFYNSLPDDVREVFDECVDEATDYQRTLFKTNFEKDVEWLEAQGVTVTENVEIDKFRAKMTPVWAEYEDEFGADLLADIKAELGIR